MLAAVTAPVLLLDGYSLLFRAHHALPPMSTEAGEPTSALYGFSALLLKLLREETPAGLAFAIDAPGGSFREIAYPDYKAGRAPTDPALIRQLQRFPALLEATGAPVHCVAGVEADDVLATLGRNLAGAGGGALVVSGDRDLLQVVGPGVEVLFVGGRGQPPVRYDAAAVERRFGLAPDRLPSFIALVGDPADNLAGVPGVGPKTAARWIRDHGSVAAVLSDLDALEPARLRAPVRGRAAELIRDEGLARLRGDVPLTPPPWGPITDDGLARLRALFEALEFRSLLPRLEHLA